jgi:hypothetical protein
MQHASGHQLTQAGFDTHGHELQQLLLVLGWGISCLVLLRLGCTV